jgi:hypothetical protein
MAKAARVVMMRVELFHDEDAGNWHFRVPALRINGGGTSSRQEAQRLSIQAIAFALEGDPRDFDSESETVAVEVRLAPAA